MSGSRVPFFGRSCLNCGVGFCSSQKPLLGAGGGEGEQGRQEEAAPGLGPGLQDLEPRARAAVGRPLQAAAGSGGPRSRRGGRAPGNTVCPHPGGSAQGRGARAPRSARRHLRIGVPDRGPLVPSPFPEAPGDRSHPWKRTPGVGANPALTRRGAAPARGLRSQVCGEGAAALRGLRLRLPRPPSALRRRSGSDFLFFGSAPPLRRTPRLGRARARPSQRRDAGSAAESSGSSVPPPRGPRASKVGRRRGRAEERD